MLRGKTHGHIFAHVARTEQRLRAARQAVEAATKALKEAEIEQTDAMVAYAEAMLHVPKRVEER